MNTPTTSDFPLHPATFGDRAAHAKRPHTTSLALERARRALRRQIWLFVLIAVLITAAGIAFEFQAGIRPAAAAWLWAPIGLAAALIVTLLRELSRDSLTFISALNKRSGGQVLGVAPELTRSALRMLAPDQRTPWGCVTFQPASPYATAFRDLQAALRREKLIAFIAPLPGEGATTVAMSAAISAVQLGRRTIIVDCDTHRRALTKELGIDAEQGLMECCETPDIWRTCVREEPESGLHILPAARMRNTWRSVLGAPGLGQFLDALRNEYDLVILDCPPALRSGEGPILAGFADKSVAVAAWDQTPLGALRQTMRVLQRGGHGKTALFVNRTPHGYQLPPV